MSKKILIVDDEKAIVDILEYNLKREGYEIVTAYNGEEALATAKSENPDLILLDVMLPEVDGLTVCKMIRKTSNIPIIMLTAKEEVVDKIIGLELGADDYMTKPFSVREVAARVKANLRKWDGIEMSKKENSENDDSLNQILEFGNLTLDSSKYDARVDGRSTEVTLKEFDLLKFLAVNKGKIFSREELLENVWGYEYFGEVRNVDVTIRRIREKIEKNPSEPKILLTKRGVGYYFNTNN